MTPSNRRMSTSKTRRPSEGVVNQRGVSKFAVGPKRFPGPTLLYSANSSARFLLVILLMNSGGGSAIFGLVDCEPAQQRGQAQAPQQQLQQSSELAALQDSSMQFASGGGASLGEGLATLAGGYRRGPYTNTKRARKMSAFMPMRGRKDGRDSNEAAGLRSQLARYLNAVQQQQQQLGRAAGRPVGWPSPSQMRESDQVDASLAQLMNGHGGGGPIPAQFFQQLHQANQQQAGSLAARPAAVSLEQVSSGRNLTPSELVGFEGGSGGGDGDQMMQAKLRRAFHPMRGKKSAPARAQEGPSEELWAGLRELVASDNYEADQDDESEF